MGLGIRIQGLGFRETTKHLTLVMTDNFDGFYSHALRCYISAQSPNLKMYRHSGLITSSTRTRRTVLLLCPSLLEYNVLYEL